MRRINGGPFDGDLLLLRRGFERITEEVRTSRAYDLREGLIACFRGEMEIEVFELGTCPLLARSIRNVDTFLETAEKALFVGAPSNH